MAEGACHLGHGGPEHEAGIVDLQMRCRGWYQAAIEKNERFGHEGFHALGVSGHSSPSRNGARAEMLGFRRR